MHPETRQDRGEVPTGYGQKLLPVPIQGSAVVIATSLG